MIERIDTILEELEGQRFLDIFISKTSVIIYTDKGLYYIPSSININRVIYCGDNLSGSTIVGVDVGTRVALIHFDDGLIEICWNLTESISDHSIFRLEDRLGIGQEFIL